jgi:PAS domain S-box-containing protein
MSSYEQSTPVRETQTTQQDLRLLLDHAPDAIGRFDRDLRHIYVNQATAKANNRPAEDFYGKTMEDLGHQPEVCAVINENLRAVFRSGTESTFEILFQGPHGPVWFECRMAPEFAEDGTVEFVLVISRDISLQKAAEAALREAEARSAKAELSASLAHGIHNPLSVVVNAIYLLQQSPTLDEPARQLLELASQQLQRVSDISKRLLVLDGQAGKHHS